MKNRKYLLESFDQYKDRYEDPSFDAHNPTAPGVESEGGESGLETIAKLAFSITPAEEEEISNAPESISPAPVVSASDALTVVDVPQLQHFEPMSGGGAEGSNTTFKRAEWAVTRVMTANGERVAMEYQNTTECEVLVSNLNYADAEKASSEWAQKLNIPEYNNEVDDYIGRVSSKVVRKAENKPTSYRY